MVASERATQSRRGERHPQTNRRPAIHDPQQRGTSARRRKAVLGRDFRAENASDGGESEVQQPLRQVLPLRHRRSQVRVALPHPRTRGQRDDEVLLRRVTDIYTQMFDHGLMY
jgi:hypothetical protein